MGYLKENLKRIIGKRYGVTCDDFFHANRWNIRIGIPNWGRDYLSVLWEVEFDSKEKAENLVNSLGSIYDLRNTISLIRLDQFMTFGIQSKTYPEVGFRLDRTIFRYSSSLRQIR